MQIIITGGAGFLGQLLAKSILNQNWKFDELVLVDIAMPNKFDDNRITCVQMDLSEEGAAADLITTQTKMVFHLAAVVSSHAEQDFDMGWKINMDITRALLEACKSQNQDIKFIFSSSIAVFGGVLPDLVLDSTALTPSSSYGSQKAIGELLVNDYSRKGYVDGRVLRLPTVCVRPGRPNLAASSFVSSIIREPLQGEEAICPVSKGLWLWLSSPDTVIKNITHAANMDAAQFKGWRTVNLPGISITVQQMLDALVRIKGSNILNKIKFAESAKIGILTK